MYVMYFRKARVHDYRDSVELDINFTVRFDIFQF